MENYTLLVESDRMNSPAEAHYPVVAAVDYIFVAAVDHTVVAAPYSHTIVVHIRPSVVSVDYVPMETPPVTLHSQMLLVEDYFRHAQDANSYSYSHCNHFRRD